jgi:hypothetical protein
VTFPSARSAHAGVQAANSTSWTLTYPISGEILDGGADTVVAGDLIVINIGRDGTTGTGSISGYGLNFNVAGGTACRGLTFTKVADGTETGTTSFAPGASEQGAWRITVYKDWWGTIATGFAVSTGATGASANPDPDTLNPASWDVEDTLWRAVCAYDDGRPTISAFPSGYTLNQDGDASGGSGGAGLGGASLQNAVASENPDTFTKTGTGSTADWVAWTIAVRPAAPPPPRVETFVNMARTRT